MLSEEELKAMYEEQPLCPLCGSVMKINFIMEGFSNIKSCAKCIGCEKEFIIESLEKKDTIDKSELICTKCGSTELEIVSVDKHEKENAEVTRYKCKVCNEINHKMKSI